MATGTASKLGRYALGILGVLAIEYLLRVVLLPVPADDIFILVATVVEWLVAGILITYWLPRVEGARLSTIIQWPLRWRDLWLGALVYVIAAVATVVAGLAVEAVGLESTRDLQPMIREYSLATLIALFLTGTVVEEIFYRGYLIERLALLTRSVWVGAAVSWLAFTFVHVKLFGLGPTLVIGVLSAALVLLYVRERRIWPCMVAHGLNGVFVYLLAPFLL